MPVLIRLYECSARPTSQWPISCGRQRPTAMALVSSTLAMASRRPRSFRCEGKRRGVATVGDDPLRFINVLAGARDILADRRDVDVCGC